MNTQEIQKNILLSSGKLSDEKNYWIRKLRGTVKISSFPTDHDVTDFYERHIEVASSQFRDEVHAKLKKVSKGSPLALLTILFAGIHCLMYKYTGEEEIAIGTPIFVKEPGNNYLNHVVILKNKLVAEDTFKSILNKAKNVISEAKHNQNYPYADIAANLNKSGGEDLKKLHTLVLLSNLQNEKILDEEKVDLAIKFSDSEEGLAFSIVYNKARYRSETIKQIINHINCFFDNILNNLDVELSEISIIDEREKKKLLFDFNQTEMVYNKKMTIQSLFEEQVKKTPDQVAVIFKNTEMTYRELNQIANKLAASLRKKGSQPNSIVGIMMNRSIEMIACILGVLKSGACYLPIDPIYPKERIQYMLKDSDTKILLTSGRLSESVEFAGCLIDVDTELRNNEDIGNLEVINNHEDLAYVIYTSGTTGNPKGVQIQHKALHNFINGMRQKINFEIGNAMLILTTICFDIFALELYIPLLSGKKVVLASEAQSQDLKLLSDLICEKNVDMLQMTPSRLTVLVNGPSTRKCLNSIKIVMVGGEPFPQKLLEGLSHATKAKIYNMYGPTETTVWSAVKKMNCAQKITLGSAIGNTQLYILDHCDKLLPIGVYGELCISGDGLSKGYLNRGELTQEKFVVNPFIENRKMYKTGDLARWTHEGEIEYLRRKDNQVKLRGYRIEIEEIEKKLLSVESVQDVIVLLNEDPTGDNYLSAFFIGEKILKIADIKLKLLKQLPEYMVPSCFVQVQEFPKLPNGKVDKKALVSPKKIQNFDENLIEPRNDVERKLIKIVQEIVAVEKIGTNSNFMSIGGHSLKAAILASRIESEFHVGIPLGMIIGAETLEHIAKQIQANSMKTTKRVEKVQEQEYYPVTEAMKVIFIENQFNDIGTRFNKPEVMIIEGKLEKKKLEESFKNLLSRHEILRTSFHLIKDEPMQKIHNDIDFKLQDITMEGIEINIAASNFMRPFDLSCDALVRAGIAPIDENNHMVIIDLHQIITDGISTNILLQELIDLYENNVLGNVNIQFKDYAVWLSEYYLDIDIMTQEQFWLNEFSHDMPEPPLPTDYERTEVWNYQADRIEYEFEKNLVDQLHKLCNETGTTLYIMLLAAYKTLLFKYSNQTEIIVGCPIAARRKPELFRMVGLIANTVAIRSEPMAEKNFDVFLNEVKQSSLLAFENQDFEYELLVEKLQIKRGLSRNPLFDTMFALHNMENTLRGKKSLSLKRCNYVNSVAKNDLTLHAYEQESGMKFDVRYRSDLFKQDTIIKIMKDYESLLMLLVKNPCIKLENI